MNTKVDLICGGVIVGILGGFFYAMSIVFLGVF